MSATRKLLENAAKAAGFTIMDVETFPPAIATAEVGYWNPLEDDGDALRLAVKLRIDVCFFDGFQEIKAEASSVHDNGSAMENYAIDMAAATRRCIVRAAAAIGEQMP